MRKTLIQLLSLALITLIISSCGDDDGMMGGDVVIPDFDFQQTVTFADSLSAYDIFDGSPAELVPHEDFHLLELSSVLFTDYAHKQRLIYTPENTQLSRLNDGSFVFPDGTILVKTFYYYNDERDQNIGKRIIETRLMIQEAGLWNVATYIWNATQTEAMLQLNGLETEVSWIDANGLNRSTVYDVPDENECIACHQANNSIIPLGTTPTNINRTVVRSAQPTNLINHLQSVGVVSNFDIGIVAQIPDYNDATQTLANRARAYMHMNCAHCHNPTAWEEPAEQDLDFRYTTAFNQTGIAMESDEIVEMVEDGEMPFIGTTILDDEGVHLIINYINSL